MDKNKQLTQLERDIVRMRYYEGLCNQEVADRLGLRLHQVKYRVKKSNVKRYIRNVVLPHIRRQRIAELEKELANPVEASVAKLIADSNAQTYVWLGPGKKHHFSNSSRCAFRRIRACRKALRIFGAVGSRKNQERDVRRWVNKYAAKLKEELKRLKAEDEAGS